MTTPNSRATRIGALAGIVSAVLFIVSFFPFGQPPDVDAPGDELAQFPVDNRTGGLVALLLIAVGIPLFALFAAGLKDRHAAVVGEGIATAAVVSGLLFWLGEGFALSTYFGAVWIDGASHAPTPAVAQALWNIASAIIGLSAPLGALYLGVAAVAGFGGAMAKWHGWVTTVVAVVVALGVLSIVSTAFSAFTFFGSVLFTLWMILTSALAFRSATP